MMGLAPIHIKPLLEIHCFPRACDQHYSTSRIEDELMAMGLIELRKGDVSSDYNMYTTSERGRVYIEAIEDVPLPVQIWAVQTREK